MNYKYVVGICDAFIKSRNFFKFQNKINNTKIVFSLPNREKKLRKFMTSYL